MTNFKTFYESAQQGPEHPLHINNVLYVRDLFDSYHIDYRWMPIDDIMETWNSPLHRPIAKYNKYSVPFYITRESTRLKIQYPYTKLHTIIMYTQLHYLLRGYGIPDVVTREYSQEFTQNPERIWGLARPEILTIDVNIYNGVVRASDDTSVLNTAIEGFLAYEKLEPLRITKDISGLLDLIQPKMQWSRTDLIKIKRRWGVPIDAKDIDDKTLIDLL